MRFFIATAGYMAFVATLVVLEGFKVSPVPEWLLIYLIFGINVFFLIIWWKILKK